MPWQQQLQSRVTAKLAPLSLYLLNSQSLCANLPKISLRDEPQSNEMLSKLSSKYEMPKKSLTYNALNRLK